MIIFLYNPATNPATNVFLGWVELVYKNLLGKRRKGRFIGGNWV
jgi:hypothetical protein